MLSTRRFDPEISISLRSTTKIATHLLLISALAVSVCCLFSAPTLAQGSLSLGTVDTPVACTPTTCTCDPNNGWYSYNGTNLNCFKTTVRGCQNANDWSLTFGYLDPSGITVTHANGTVVIFTGDGGLQRALNGTFAFADNYFKAGYEIVELAWNDDWEYTSDPIPAGSHGNIQNAACRPATFLKKYVYDVLFAPPGGGGILGNNSRAGFCAHAISAGSAAVAYSLAYYGAGSWLDNVELLSGPVFGDVKQGCEKPVANPVTVCGLNGGNQYGCKLGTGGSTWTLSPTYGGPASQVGLWTGDTTCASSELVTTSASNAAWLAQSVVDQSTGATPTFTYNGTAMAAWLCRSVDPIYGQPNNSSPQGQIFYANFTASQQPYAVYAVDNCQGAENVGMGTVPGYVISNLQGGKAITDDMVGSGNIIQAQCFRRLHQ